MINDIYLLFQMWNFGSPLCDGGALTLNCGQRNSASLIPLLGDIEFRQFRCQYFLRRLNCDLT